MTAPIIVAHRGLHHALPENSLAGFELAVAEGFWVECDVRASRDGVPIILHDETLDRTADASGRVDALDAIELQHIPLKEFDQTIPTLEEALRGGGKWLVEIKPPAARELVRRVVHLLEACADKWMVQSFHAENIRELWAYHPSAAGALLVEERDVLERSLGEDWPAVHVSHELLTPQVRQRLRRRGCSVGVWTVNEPADITRVLALDVRMIITDDPHRARDLTGRPLSGT